MAQRPHGFPGRVRKARKGGGRRDRAIVIVGRMGAIAFRIITRGQSPAGFAIALVLQRIAHAMLVIDAHMARILLAIIGIAVPEAARIEAAEGIMCEEQRSAIGGTERQFDAVIGSAIEEIAADGIAIMVGVGRDAIT